MVVVVGTEFVGRDQFGDFNWMISREDFQDSLFLFNDNEEDHHTARRGAGNAVIRQFNKYSKKVSKPRSCGIPTGTLSKGGYADLSPRVKDVIDEAFAEIEQIIAAQGYQRVFYSADSSGRLGTSIFAVSDRVIDYITQRIRNLEQLAWQRK